MLEAIKQSRALKWLLIWGGILVGLLLAIHFFSKKQPGANGAAGAIPPTTYNISNKTVLVNGYPAGGSSSGGSGSSGSSGGGSGGVHHGRPPRPPVPPVPTPTPTPSPVPPPSPAPSPAPAPAPRPTQVRQITLPTAMTWAQIAQNYAGGAQNASWVFGWNNQLHSQPWWTVNAGTRINIPSK